VCVVLCVIEPDSLALRVAARVGVGGGVTVELAVPLALNVAV